MTIVEFLLARIAEDEAVARVASQTIGDGEWLSGGDVVKSVTLAAVATTPVGHHVARHDPARVLAECQAKRAIIEQVSDIEWTGSYAVRDVVLGHLVAVYDTHPDYNEAWRP